MPFALLSAHGSSYMYSYYNIETLLIVAILCVTVLGLIAQARVQSIYKKYSKVPAHTGMTASQVASALLRNSGSSVGVAATPGNLTDNYNPRTGTVSLSQSTYSSNSIAAIAVAAHEVGHVMQYESGYTPIRIRNSLLPVASFASNFSYLIVVAGLFLDKMGYYVCIFGALLFCFAFLFQLLTLPIELNASRRALNMLTEQGFIMGAEQENSAKKVLRAAAFTYVVAALASFVSLLRLFAIANSKRR